MNHDAAHKFVQISFAFSTQCLADVFVITILLSLIFVSLFLVQYSTILGLSAL